MTFLRLLLIFLGVMIIPLKVETTPYFYRFENNFKAWEQKQLDLISLFLTSDPIVLTVGKSCVNESLSFAKHWPNSKITAFEPKSNTFEALSSKIANYNNIKAYQIPIADLKHINLDNWCEKYNVNHIDFLQLNLQKSKYFSLKNSSKTLEKVKVIYITSLFSSRNARVKYLNLKKFLEQSGFLLIAHWHGKKSKNNSIFIKKDFYYNLETEEFLKNNSINNPKYQIHYEPFFKSRYYLDDEDSAKVILKQGYAYEGNIGIIIKELTKPGSLAIDVGSHIGVHTITMSKKVGSKGAVIAFEPDKKLYMELLNNLILNNCTNVIPIAKGLGETVTTGILTNYSFSKNIIEQDKSKKNVKGDLVEIIPLDFFNIVNLSLIKIDVENYEYFTLKGAKETILRNKPVIIFECWIDADYENSDPWKKDNFDRVISLLESYGYEIYVIYNNDFIAFPIDADEKLKKYKNNFRRLNLNVFDIGL